MTGAEQSGDAQRLDRWLVYCRFARTRSRAATLIEEGHIRCNGAHVRKSRECVHPGDVLTIPLGKQVRIIEVLSLPQRRGPPVQARSHYRELDRGGDIAIAP